MRTSLLAVLAVAFVMAFGGVALAQTPTDDAYPVHVLAVNAMGLHLLDYLQLDPLAASDIRQRRCPGRQQSSVAQSAAQAR